MLPPAALGVLAGVCRDVGVDYDFLDFNVTLHNALTSDQWLEMDNWLIGVSDDISQEILDVIDLHWKIQVTDKMQDFDFLCISVLSYWSLKIAMHIANKHNNKNRNYTIVIGGAGVQNNVDGIKGITSLGSWVLMNRYVDFVVYGDGEPYFDKILTGRAKNPHNLNELDTNSDINSYPVPYYGGIRTEDYKIKGAYITGSRGCVRKCTFCDIETTWPTFRYRSAKLLIEEIKQNFYELGIERFEFTDSLINGSVSNFYKFNTLLAEEKQRNPDLKNINYVGQFIARPKRQMPPSHYEAMYYAGCRQITVGIESFSEKIRDQMKKKFSNTDIEYHIKQCAYWGIPNIWLMITGYPTETLEDHSENLKGIKKFAPYAKIGTLEMIRWGTTLHYIDGTPLTRQHMLDEYQIVETGTNSEVRPGSSYTWKSNLNPDLTLTERIRRRLELHKHTVHYRIPQARAFEDLKILNTMANNG